MNQLLRKNYVKLMVLLCLIVSVGTLWMYYSRYQDYRFYQYQVGVESTNGVGPQISAFVAETRRLVDVYSSKHQELLQQIVDSPENEKLRLMVDRDLRLYFPKMLTYTLADSSGQPYWEDFDGLIGELCSRELASFANGNPSLPAIHPIHDGYHFDVMTQFEYKGKKHILFVSFLAGVLGDLLNSANTPDHQVMLILPDKNDLIEVVPGGARDTLNRNDYRLSASERNRILVRKPVSGTQWDVVDLIEADVLQSYLQSLVIEALTIIVVFIGTGFTLVFNLWRKDNARKFAEQQREEIQRQKDAMIAVVTHEFRTPLTAIHGAIDLMKFTLGNDAERSLELQQIAERNTLRLQLLINDFLDLKQLESNEYQLTLAQEDLVALTEECVVANSTYAQQFNVTLDYQKPAAPIWVEIDSHRVMQVISNLVSNAIKYGGENKQVEIRIKNGESSAILSVTDHGEGIPEQDQSKLFKSFSMLSANPSRQKVKGTGLGLSIVKSIVDKHQGSINFKSVVGEGTTFFCEFPKFRRQSSSDEETSSMGADTENPKRAAG